MEGRGDAGVRGLQVELKILVHPNTHTLEYSHTNHALHPFIHAPYSFTVVRSSFMRMNRRPYIPTRKVVGCGEARRRSLEGGFFDGDVHRTYSLTGS